MKKFSEIEYVRPDMEVEKEKIGAYTEALKNVKSYEELRGLFMKGRFSSGMRRFRRFGC